jgi:hypothetical protein
MMKKLKTITDIAQFEPLTTSNINQYSWDKLTTFQKQQIDAGLDDIKHGRVLSSEQFWNQLKNN